MANRRKFLTSSAAGLALLAAPTAGLTAAPRPNVRGKALVISTWDDGIAANQAAWEILKKGGAALDAAEAGVMVTESSQNCCVGLGGNPDRDGIVTLDACIMDHRFNCGSVAALERIKHPISVARRVMEKTPHVMLVGEGAQQFAVAQGFPLEPSQLSPDAEKAYKEWLKTSQYKPVINIENSGNRKTGPVGGPQNHDTIALLALDATGNLSGSCTTSGMGFKMRGRVGDSPIIGAGLYVDNEVGAAAATGQGEDVIRMAGAHTVVELMRQGLSPMAACRAAVERVARIKGAQAKDIQVCFIAVNNQGVTGAYALQKGFSYALCNAANQRQLFKSEYLLK
ncbi:N(4)-(beta-N-acetylglucosaminyl)-L-asparaginase [Hymenobacter ginsengisoli]|uniref:N(4)-(Beta-N-acetylglucosaminyl)-L-asparaginase n=1 Tax=Hymenobacter ginsengisoli TaxID=1051626 RepID=A0ABP8PYA5_9BACT|nr:MULTISPECIES: N(4)-(beta-N-acetylglucosaminyl)-L-asparaginase [unclassified Hymenobacter]MBO2030422.1 N(4)-(beta-N-acetylglucosaminyl)-L-asparaginase [Hymenobacter sp. BT559]